jgi:hypothetical protein
MAEIPITQEHLWMDRQGWRDGGMAGMQKTQEQFSAVRPELAAHAHDCQGWQNCSFCRSKKPSLRPRHRVRPERKTGAWAPVLRYHAANQFSDST